MQFIYQAKGVRWELDEAADQEVDVDVAWDDGARVEGEAVVNEGGREPVEVLDKRVFPQIGSPEQVQVGGSTFLIVLCLHFQ